MSHHAWYKEQLDLYIQGAQAVARNETEKAIIMSNAYGNFKSTMTEVLEKQLKRYREQLKIVDEESRESLEKEYNLAFSRHTYVISH